MANSGVPKVYDVLGKEVKAANKTALITAVKDKTADLLMNFHIGADGTTNNKININIAAMSAKGLGVNGLKVNGTDGIKATDAIEKEISDFIELLEVKEYDKVLSVVQKKGKNQSKPESPNCNN